MHHAVLSDVWAVPGVTAIIDKLVMHNRAVHPFDRIISQNVPGKLSRRADVKAAEIESSNGGSTDQAIAKMVRANLDRTALLDLDPDAISIDVRNGKVTLTGIVSSWAAYSAACKAARNTPGVVKTHNGIILGP